MSEKTRVLLLNSQTAVSGVDFKSSVDLLQVIQRIFYTVNRSWSGKITLTELRKSNFLQVCGWVWEQEPGCSSIPCSVPGCWGSCTGLQWMSQVLRSLLGILEELCLSWGEKSRDRSDPRVLGGGQGVTVFLLWGHLEQQPGCWSRQQEGKQDMALHPCEVAHKQPRRAAGVPRVGEQISCLLGSPQPTDSWSGISLQLRMKHLRSWSPQDNEWSLVLVPVPAVCPYVRIWISVLCILPKRAPG